MNGPLPTEASGVNRNLTDLLQCWCSRTRRTRKLGHTSGSHRDDSREPNGDDDDLDEPHHHSRHADRRSFRTDDLRAGTEPAHALRVSEMVRGLNWLMPGPPIPPRTRPSPIHGPWHPPSRYAQNARHRSQPDGLASCDEVMVTRDRIGSRHEKTPQERMLPGCCRPHGQIDRAGDPEADELSAPSAAESEEEDQHLSPAGHISRR